MSITATHELNAEESSAFVQTPKHKIHYYQAGTAGTPIVLIHGSGPGANGWTNFSPNITELSREHRVFAIDMPGWGRSDTPESERDDPQVLVDFLDKLGIEKAALVGNSLGGVNALGVAVRFPERVSHVITMGSPVPGTNIFAAGGGPSEGMSVLVKTYAEPTPENFKRLVEVMCFDPTMATDELAELRAEAASARPEHLASFLQWIRSGNVGWAAEYMRNYSNRLAEIDLPVLAIHGRDDRVVHFENSLRLVSLVPNSRLVIFNQCGHWAQLEHAAEFNRIVAGFIDNH
ncbi:MAG: alpha/beta fold hydrolase [Comamonadaceae bacterium]|nr:MAG: alpha/beta fold hydrolase [Comamonadaceae bacterium]